MKIFKILLLMVLAINLSVSAQNTNLDNLKIVIIRHAEKPEKGDNLTCQGLNRALLLPKLLNAKFGIPAYIFVPAIGLGESTKHSRMFQTIGPFAMKYNLTINTSHEEKDSLMIAKDLKSRKGTLLLVWEHKAIAPIVRSLGVNAPNLKWSDDDYDSIWIITFKNGNAILTKDKEGLAPSKDCTF
jgi:hypothetical protein